LGRTSASQGLTGSGVEQENRESGGFNRKDFKSANDANLHKFLTAEFFNRKGRKDHKWRNLKNAFLNHR
jgi:hypothetical protein